MLAVNNLMEHLRDHPWPGWEAEWFGVPVTLMSSGIAAMILSAVVLIAIILPAARKRREAPSGLRNVLEVVVLFVRDRIGKPALGVHTGEYLPFLLTMFVFILTLNLMGMVPLEAVSELLHMEDTTPLGVTATTIPAVCMALAGITLIAIVLNGLRRAACRARRERNWPAPLALALSPVLWVMSLSPSVPGVTGKILAVPLSALELVGAVMKCFALMIRLLANMLAGHALIGVLVMLLLQALAAMIETGAMQLVYVGPLVVIAGVAVNILELLVAGLQAYIFTFLSAMFLGLYVETSH